jgi:hypothetical protein
VNFYLQQQSLPAATDLIDELESTFQHLSRLPSTPRVMPMSWICQAFALGHLPGFLI